ncbi:carboxylesterase/lipase family protein [Actinomadura rupiterrae]|uniref:carboxylesterase/lipase family protein n=1 Tax=Actinomadura rupiterrae TaxID=559627 RepID=UPI0020A2DDDA|nr:carboxylesterase family protein [Actinomadura rupiterrae]MCP2336156.1 para-nitrobenzyl esterase [Actinomadura rupiterrae]
MAQQVTVRTKAGDVAGERRADGSARFLGIPFAQAPVGDLRFAAPVPVRPWDGTRPATAYGPTAQRRPFAEVTTIPEPTIPGAEILNLNVFTPDPSASLPVLVWIHGGGFVAGCNASPWYDGAAFARDGVVLVSIGYRLGIEGFLHLADAPDNRGVLDWIAALRWVQENIASFGGDASKVTIAGQSAGGGAVRTLMATPSAQGLFRAAISVSGAVMEPQSRADGLAVAERFTERTGLPATAQALRDVSDARMLELQDALTAPEPGEPPKVELLTAPFADGELVPVPVPEARAAAVPLMLGFTHQEFNMIPERVMPDLSAELVAPSVEGLGLPTDSVADYLALHEGERPAAVVGQALTDALFRAPGVAMAERHIARDLPTWLYQFDWTDPHGMAYHCLDLPFAFDVLHAEGVQRSLGDEPPQRLADAMHSAWVGFVRDLDPGANWPRYEAERRATMLWDAEPRVVDDVLAPVRTLWSGPQYR